MGFGALLRQPHRAQHGGGARVARQGDEPARCVRQRLARRRIQHLQAMLYQNASIYLAQAITLKHAALCTIYNGPCKEPAPRLAAGLMLKHGQHIQASSIQHQWHGQHGYHATCLSHAPQLPHRKCKCLKTNCCTPHLSTWSQLCGHFAAFMQSAICTGCLAGTLPAHIEGQHQLG